jgi:hypothetical protein
MHNKHQITYEGNLSDDLRSFMCTTLKQAMSDNIPEARRITKLVGFAIELLDNAQRYGEDMRVQFEWKALDNELVIEVKNIATMENAKRLEEQADRINQLSLTEIESEYKAKLMNSDFNDHGGAGLGLLQIMKNGAQNLRINVQEMNDGVWSCVSSVLVPLTKIEFKA